jgi:hypothetical protein
MIWILQKTMRTVLVKSRRQVWRSKRRDGKENFAGQMVTFAVRYDWANRFR